MKLWFEKTRSDALDQVVVRIEKTDALA